MWWDADDQTQLPGDFLSPFHTNTSGGEWTSDKQRNWLDLNYSYPELQRWLPKYKVDGKFDEKLYQSDVVNQIFLLYGTASQLAFSQPEGYTISPYEGAELLHSEDEDVKELNDFVVNVLYKRFALDGASYLISIYFGEDEVGTVYNFCSPLMLDGEAGACAKCLTQKAAGSMSTGQVPLNIELQWRIGMPGGPVSEKKTDIVDWLTENLNWKVTVSQLWFEID